MAKDVVMTNFVVTLVGLRQFKHAELDAITETIRTLVRDRDRNGGLIGSKPDYSVVDVSVTCAGAVHVTLEREPPA